MQIRYRVYCSKGELKKLKYYTKQKSFCLKTLSLGFWVTSFCCFAFKNTPSRSFKYFKSSDTIVVKKKSLLKVY